MKKKTYGIIAEGLDSEILDEILKKRMSCFQKMLRIISKYPDMKLYSIY